MNLCCERLKLTLTIDQNSTGDVPVIFFAVDHTDSVVLADENKLILETQHAHTHPREADFGGLVGISSMETTENISAPEIERSRERPVFGDEVSSHPLIETEPTGMTFGAYLTLRRGHDDVHNWGSFLRWKQGLRNALFETEIPYGAGRGNHILFVMRILDACIRFPLSFVAPTKESGERKTHRRQSPSTCRNTPRGGGSPPTMSIL